MGYQNLNTGNLREQRRAARRQETAAPVGQSAVGHGSGLRFYDGGELIIDGDNISIRFRIAEKGGGASTAFMQYLVHGLSSLAAEPGTWVDSQTGSLVLAGPLMDTSTAADGYGGSNLYLNGRSLTLGAGINGVSPGLLEITDTGLVQLRGSGGRLSMYTSGELVLSGDPHYLWFQPDGGIRLVGSGASVTLGADGGAKILGGKGAVTVTAAGGVSLDAAKGSITNHPDGAWSIGHSDGAIMQGGASGGLTMWPGSGGLKVTGDFSVTGSKNFVMPHPEREGWLIRYGSTESPVSGIECRGRVTLDQEGVGQVELPDHFRAIVKPGTDVDMTVQAYSATPAWCEPPTTAGTTVHGGPGDVVAWHASAERVGGDFQTLEQGSLAEPVVPTTDEPTAEEAP